MLVYVLGGRAPASSWHGPRPLEPGPMLVEGGDGLFAPIFEDMNRLRSKPCTGLSWSVTTTSTRTRFVLAWRMVEARGFGIRWGTRRIARPVSALLRRSLR